MRRVVLITILVAALGVAVKLALKPTPPLPSPSFAHVPHASTDPSRSSDVAAIPDTDSALLARFAEEREMVERLLQTYGHNARRIAATNGRPGLRLLDKLGDAAVCLYEERPGEFRELCAAVAAGADSVDLVGAWGQYFNPRRVDKETIAALTAELRKLPARARRLAEETPEALPFLLSDRRRTTDILERLGPAALEPLALVDLSDGGDSLRRALAVIERHGQLVIAATEELGPAGFLVMERFGPLVAELEPELGLRHSLVVVAAAIEDIEEILQTHRTSALARTIVHLKSAGLLDDAAGTRHGLKLAVEYGQDGEGGLRVAGPRVAGLVYELYPKGPLRNAVVRAIVGAGLPAAVAAEKYADSEPFRRVVERDGAPAIVAIAAACSAEEARAFLAAKPDRTWSEALALSILRLSADSGDKTVRTIDRDGLERVQYLASSTVKSWEMLPLYDLSHLGGVLVKGHVPTRGELAWAGLDAGLVAFDAFCLLALQPEGAVAGEAARASAKSAARAGMKTGARAAVRETTESLAARATRTTATEIARDASRQVTGQATAAGRRVAETASLELANQLARRSGIRLMRWESVVAATSVANAIANLPRSRLTKYVAANAAQAGVGLLAIRKMEEYLAGRKDNQDARSTPNSTLGGLSHEAQ